MSKLLILIWTVWSFFITVIVFFLFLPINLLLIFCLGNLGKNLFVRYTSNYIGNLLIFLFGMKKQITGFYPLHHTGPCIYIVNHKSYLDLIIVASLVPHKIKYLGKAEVFKWPFFGFLARHSGQIPVQREDKDSRNKGYDLMKQALSDGYSIILFPEGGWKNPGNKSPNPYNLEENKLLQNFRNGAFRLAMEAKVPIVPILLLNAQERFSDITMRVIPGLIKVHVFDLIQSNRFQDSFDLNHKCYKIMLEQLEKYNI